MNSLFKKSFEKPIFILLAVNILVGLFVFRDYGFSWDEPLFYSYADALGYAYSPKEWFSGNFNHPGRSFTFWRLYFSDRFFCNRFFHWCIRVYFNFFRHQ